MKIKILLIFGFLFFVITPSVFAASSSFLVNAQKWYDESCTRRPERVRGDRATLCYLFDKVEELETGGVILSPKKETFFEYQQISDSPTSNVVDASGYKLITVSITGNTQGTSFHIEDSSDGVNWGMTGREGSNLWIGDLSDTIQRTLLVDDKYYRVKVNLGSNNGVGDWAEASAILY